MPRTVRCPQQSYNNTHFYFKMTETVLLDGKTLTTSQLDHIIKQKLHIDLTEETWARVRKSREIIQNMMCDGKKVVYGINTGFGNFADKIISVEERALLQNNLIRSHAVCVGKPLPLDSVKRMMILRINTLSKGRSGFAAQNMKKYIDACNADYLPMIPCKGTVGASGDLAPLSHLALGMLGMGKAWDQKTQKYIDAKQVMEYKKLSPVKLGEKQGLALINGTQFMSSIISQVQVLSRKVLQSAIVIFAMAAQIFGMQHLTKQMKQYYATVQPSLGKIINKFTSYFDEEPSELLSDRTQKNHKNIQAHSLTQSLQNFSSVLQTLDICQRMINQQLNSATDNPLVYGKQDGFETDRLISGGNFHGEYVAKVSDFIAMSLQGLGKFSEARIQRYVNERTSNLPGFLVSEGGLNSGYMIIQYTAAALVSQNKVLSKPASADSISTSASQQDHVSMGGYAARKSRQLLENVAYILGIQFMCALQAIDLIDKKPSTKLDEIKNKARKSISYLKVDNYFGPEMQIAKQMVLAGLGSLLEPDTQQN